MSQQPTSLAFTLFDIEQSIARRDYIKFEKYLISLLEFIDLHGGVESTLQTNTEGKDEYSHIGLIPFNNKTTFTEKLNLYSRLAATITTYLSDNEHVPNDVLLIHIIILKTHISNIFYLSCYGSMDHILFNRGLLDSNNTLNLKTEQDIKFLYVCLSLNSNIEFDVEMLVNAIPLWGMYWYLGLLYGYLHSYNQQIESNLNKVVDAHPLIQTMVFDNSAVEMSASPWMLCSYLDRSDRHEIKKSINAAIQKWIIDKQLPPGTLKKVSSYIDKTTSIKKIVVLSEKYTSIHAMYRCYHIPIAELRKHYHVTLISTPNDFDDISKLDFNQVIEVKDSAKNFKSVIEKIAQIKPDLIFYPSLGMSKWTIPLSNIRLAKYQMMAYGHPASAFSKYIDAGITSALPEGPDYQRYCVETVTPYHDHNIFISPHPELESLQLKERTEDGTVRIAINSALMKITKEFLNLCLLIQKNSSQPIEFHFFMIDSQGCKLTAFEKSLSQQELPFQIHPAASYKEYMNNLNQCHLAIGTFPFGGTNTNIDLISLGIPKIFYTDGSDIASFTDLCVMNKFDLPDILMAESKINIVTSAIYLIHDSKERERINEYIKSHNTHEILFNEQYHQDDHLLIKAINWLQSHEKGEKDKITTVEQT